MKAATEALRIVIGDEIISIHAAREGGDLAVVVPHILRIISIHAAREGGDDIAIVFTRRNYDFNPRRP